MTDLITSLSSNLEYVLSMLGFLSLWMIYSFWGMSFSEVKEYFKTKTGNGILHGIVVAMAVAVVLGLVGCSGKYFNDATVYAGLDRLESTKNSICQSRGIDENTTSNLGVKVNAYRSVDEKYSASIKATHHSCAFSPDGYGYDGVGAEFEYKFWTR